MIVLSINLITTFVSIFSFLIIYILNKKKILLTSSLVNKKRLVRFSLLKKRNFRSSKVNKEIFLNSGSINILETKLLEHYVEYTGRINDEISVKELNKILFNYLKLNAIEAKNLRYKLFKKHNVKEVIRKTRELKSYRCILGLKRRDLVHFRKGLFKLNLLKKKNFCFLKTNKKTFLNTKLNTLSIDEKLLEYYIEYTGKNYDEIPVKTFNNISLNYLKLTKIETKELRSKLLEKSGVKEMVRKTKERKSYRCIIGLKINIYDNNHLLNIQKWHLLLFVNYDIRCILTFYTFHFK